MGSSSSAREISLSFLFIAPPFKEINLKQNLLLVP